MQRMWRGKKRKGLLAKKKRMLMLDTQKLFSMLKASGNNNVAEDKDDAAFRG
jgi:hypothetical protein